MNIRSTAAFIAGELLDENISIRAEYEARLAAAHRLLSENIETIAKLYAALVAVQPHTDRLPVAVAEQIGEAVAIIGMAP